MWKVGRGRSNFVTAASRVPSSSKTAINKFLQIPVAQPWNLDIGPDVTTSALLNLSPSS